MSSTDGLTILGNTDRRPESRPRTVLGMLIGGEVPVQRTINPEGFEEERSFRADPATDCKTFMDNAGDAICACKIAIHAKCREKVAIPAPTNDVEKKCIELMNAARGTRNKCNKT